MNPRSPLHRWLRSTGIDSNPLGAAALLAIIVTLVLSAITLWPLLQARNAKPAAPVAHRDPAKSANQFDDSIQHQVAQIDGRSLFAIPIRPGPDKPQIVAKVYAGPQMIAFVNGTAWFADGQKISEESPKSRTLELIHANPPWSVRVKWEGGEFDVDLFKRVTVSSLNDPLKFGAPSLWTAPPKHGAAPAPSSSFAPPASLPGPGQGLRGGPGFSAAPYPGAGGNGPGGPTGGPNGPGGPGGPNGPGPQGGQGAQGGPGAGSPPPAQPAPQTEPAPYPVFIPGQSAPATPPAPEPAPTADPNAAPASPAPAPPPANPPSPPSDP